MKFKPSFYAMTVDLPQANDSPAPPRSIAYSTRSGKALVIDRSLADAFKRGEFDSLPENVLETLVKNMFIVPQVEDEFSTCLDENIAFLEDNQALSFTIQPTGNCQLGCHYCGQLHRNVTMTNEVMDKAYDRILDLVSKKDYKRIEITWYGGEPLMAVPAIKYLSEKLIRFCREKQITYVADMITNGFVLSGPKMDELVKDCKVTAYQITLDGLPEYHDVNRYTKKNRPSFDKIYSNIKEFVQGPLFRQHNCNLTIRMNINRDNADGVPPFIDFLAEEGLNKYVKLDFVGIVDWGNNGASANSLSMEEFAAREIEWYVHSLRKGFEMPAILPERQYGVCMVIDPNSEVYDAYGNIYPCYELPYTPGYEDGKDLIGNLKAPGKDKPLSEVPLRNWNENVKDPKYGCNTCPFFPVCGGGCPKSWYSGSVPCPSFKKNIEQRLILNYAHHGTTAAI